MLKGSSYEPGQIFSWKYETGLEVIVACVDSWTEEFVEGKLAKFLILQSNHPSGYWSSGNVVGSFARSAHFKKEEKLAP